MDIDMENETASERNWEEYTENSKGRETTLSRVHSLENMHSQHACVCVCVMLR